jgi:hypothetical protein
VCKVKSFITTRQMRGARADDAAQQVTSAPSVSLLLFTRPHSNVSNTQSHCFFQNLLHDAPHHGGHIE